MNRKSYFWPIVLILLGLALLARNFWPQLSLTRLFAAHWPWILVCWGGFRLLEAGIALIRRQAPPDPLGGGGIALAVLLILAGSATHALEGGLMRHFWFPGWPHHERFRLIQPTPPLTPQPLSPALIPHDFYRNR